MWSFLKGSIHVVTIILIFCLMSFITFTAADMITTYAGTGTCTPNNVYRTSRMAKFKSVASVYADSVGNIYFTDNEDHRVRKISSNGTLSIFAGNRVATPVDNVPATSSGVFNPSGITGDTNGNIYVSTTYGNIIRKIDVKTNLIKTVVGLWSGGAFVDNVRLNMSKFKTPTDIFFDNMRNVMYIADLNNHRIRKADFNLDFVSTIAGTGYSMPTAIPMLATFTNVSRPTAIWADIEGNVYVGESYRIRKIDVRTGMYMIVAGVGSNTNVNANGAATTVGLTTVQCLHGDNKGNIYYGSDASLRINQLNLTTNYVTTYVGMGTVNAYAGEASTNRKSTSITPISGCYLDTAGRLYFGESVINRLRRTTLADTVETFAGSGSACIENRKQVSAREVDMDVYDIWMTTTGDMYYTSQQEHSIGMVSRSFGSSGLVNNTIIAGTGVSSFSGDNGPATSAGIASPFGIGVDEIAGHLYFSDYGNHRIRRINLAKGIISTVAGYGCSNAANPANDGPATSALVCHPRGLHVYFNSVKRETLVYFTEVYADRLRMYNTTSKTLQTVVGYNATSQTVFPFNAPLDVWVNSMGIIYLLDKGGAKIRSISPTTQYVTPYAGSGSGGVTTTKALATATALGSASAICGDTMGNIYVGGDPSARIRRVGTDGYIYWQAGDAKTDYLFNGDEISPYAARLGTMQGCFVDTNGVFYFGQYWLGRIRKIDIFQPTSMPSGQPSRQPMGRPSGQPSRQPTSQPTRQPMSRPTGQPSRQPTSQPTRQPLNRPTAQPSRAPTSQPSRQPLNKPTGQPSREPTSQPSRQPINHPTGQPSRIPTSQPSRQPINHPTGQPTRQPMSKPTGQPSRHPSSQPSRQPFGRPTGQPSKQPYGKPSSQPSVQPIAKPTSEPSAQPTSEPSAQPFVCPTGMPTGLPSVIPTSAPTASPTSSPSSDPTVLPSSAPASSPTDTPSSNPTIPPSVIPSISPTTLPSTKPSMKPTALPTALPSSFPSSVPSSNPTSSPSSCPSAIPTVVPTSDPTSKPTAGPSPKPTPVPSTLPTPIPSTLPTPIPSTLPTPLPSTMPSLIPTGMPTPIPTVVPFQTPTESPTRNPTLQPTEIPTIAPSDSPTLVPTLLPSENPSQRPTEAPSEVSTEFPSEIVQTLEPTPVPTMSPSMLPSFNPSNGPTELPTVIPSAGPTLMISTNLPTVFPSKSPSPSPTEVPTLVPTATISVEPTINPSKFPTQFPTQVPTVAPSVIADQSSSPTKVPTAVQSVVVSIVTTPTIGSCDSMLLDLTGSSGSMGSNWRNISYNLDVSPALNEANMSALVKFLDNSLSTSVPMKIPSFYIPPEHSYSFRFTLCNIANRCGWSDTVSIKVVDASESAPIVLISGSKIRTMIASSSISLSSIAYVNKCDGKASNVGLEYSWKVIAHETNEVQSNAVSIVKDATKFKTKSNALSTGMYDVVLTVSDSRSGLSSQSIVTLYVQPSPLVVKLNPSISTLLVRVGSSFTMDASSSYDPDSTSGSSHLLYLWSCFSYSGGSCPLMTSDSATSLSTMWSATEASLNTTTKIMVTVIDSTREDRNSSAAITVTVIEGDAPLVNIQTDASSMKNVNVDNRLTISGSVVSTSTCFATWGLAENYTMSLSAVAMTPLAVSVKSGVNIPVPLILKVNALKGRASYTFILSCGKSSASIVVTTNGAPYGGGFVTDPSESGKELTTLFMLSASQWLDEDVPLMYQFSFSSGGRDLTIRSKSELGYTSTMLPSGLAKDNYLLNVSVTVFDSLSASSSTTKVLQVSPIDQTELQAAVLSSLESLSSSTSVDELAQLISVSSAALNRVDCTNAPDCSELNRNSCEKVENTCGTCLDNYFGQAGDGNSMCFSKDSLLSYSKNNESATSIIPNKKCPMDCSNHGSCVYRNTVGNEIVTSCSILSTSCAAKCVCDEGYGSTSCSLTAEEVQMQQSIRRSMLQGISTILGSSLITSVSSEVSGKLEESNALSAVSSIASIVRGPDDLSEESSAALRFLIDDILDSVDSSTFSGSSISKFSSILDSINTLVNFDRENLIRTSNRRLSVSSESMVPSLVSFSELVINNTIAGDASTSFLQDNFRIALQVFAGATENGDADSLGVLSMQLPQSPFEQLSQQVPISISPAAVDSIDTKDNKISLQAIQMETSSFLDNAVVSNLQSSVVMVKSSVNVPYVLVTIPMSDAAATQLSSSSTSVTEETHDIVCKRDQVETQDVACAATASTIPVQCDGRAATIRIRCPRELAIPSCTILEIDQSNSELSELPNGGDGTCDVTDYTNSFVTCKCSTVLQNNEQQFRKLESSAASVLKESGFLSTGLMIKYIAEEFSATIITAEDVSLSTASSSIIVLIMFTLLWTGGFLMMLMIWRRKNRVEDRVKAKKLFDRRLRRQNQVGITGNKHEQDEHKEIHDGEHHENQKEMMIADYLLQYISSALPAVYKTSSSFVVKVKDELLHNHLCFNILFGSQEGSKPWLVGLFELLTLQTMMMFMLAVLYDLQGPEDDGSCVSKHDEATCIARKSILDNQQSYCSWELTANGDNTASYHCIYNPVEFTPLLVVYVAAFTSICTALFSKPLIKLFEILSAPTEESIKASVVSAAFLQLQKKVVSAARRASAAAIQLKNAIVPMQAVSVTEAVVISHAKYVPKETEKAYKHARTSMDMLGPALQHMVTQRLAHDQETKMKRRDVSNGVIVAQGGAGATWMHELQEDLRKQRKAFAFDHSSNDALVEQKRLRQRKLFDEQWGLSSTTGVPDDNIQFGANVKDAIEKTLVETEELKTKTTTFLKSTPDHHKGLEILQLFIQDLLGRDSAAARIFKSKVEEDYRELPVVKKWHKYVALTIILLLNGFFIFFAILRGASRGSTWQRSYMLACVMQFLLDILFFETLECVWINVFIPSVVTKEVNRIHMTLHAAVHQMVTHALYEEDEDADYEGESKVKILMSAADHLFVSTKVAKVYPQLMESVIVLSYQTFMPGEIARHWGAKSLLFDDSQTTQQREKQGIVWRCMSNMLSGIRKFMALLLTFLLVPLMSRIPLGFQKMVLRFIQPFLLGGLAYLYYSIVKDLTYMIVAVAVLAVVFAGVCWKVFLDQRAARRLSQLTDVDNAARASRQRLRRRNNNVSVIGSNPYELKTSTAQHDIASSSSQLSSEQSSNNSESSNSSRITLSDRKSSFQFPSSADRITTFTSDGEKVNDVDDENDDDDDDNDLSRPISPRRQSKSKLSVYSTSHQRSTNDEMSLSSHSFELSDESFSDSDFSSMR